MTVTIDVSTATVKQLEAYVGGLGNPSKMPGLSYGIPAARCQTGSKLRTVAGSTCHGCYALKGRYVFAGVQAALERRFASLELEHWADAMAELLNRKQCKWFRWHDSGDLQSVDHLRRIVQVCELTPDCRHWLPTREYRIVSDFIAAGGIIPANLTVRLSAHMVGGHVPTFPRLAGVRGITVSTVSPRHQTPDDGSQCQAQDNGNVCGDCRACWDPNVVRVNYRLH